MTGEHLCTRLVEIPELDAPANVEALYYLDSEDQLRQVADAARRRGADVGDWVSPGLKTKAYARWEDPLGCTVTIVAPATMTPLRVVS